MCRARKKGYHAVDPTTGLVISSSIKCIGRFGYAAVIHGISVMRGGSGRVIRMPYTLYQYMVTFLFLCMPPCRSGRTRTGRSEVLHGS